MILTARSMGEELSIARALDWLGFKYQTHQPVFGFTRFLVSLDG